MRRGRGQVGAGSRRDEAEPRTKWGVASNGGWSLGQHRGEAKAEKSGSDPAGSSEDSLPCAGGAAPARSLRLGGPRVAGEAGRLRVCLLFVFVSLPFSVSWRKPGRAGADRRIDPPTVPHLCLATRTPISLDPAH